MPGSRSTPHRLAGALSVLVLSGCNGPGGGPAGTPAGPGGAADPSPALERVYDGEAVQIVDAVSLLCDLDAVYSSVPADPQVQVRGDFIEFFSYSDWVGYESLRGTWTNGSFAAMSSQRAAVDPCLLREIWFSGTSSDDFESFEAHETDVYGPPGDQVTTEWHWTFRAR